jgi:hypothetical protein
MVAKVTSITKKHTVFTITLTAHLDNDSKYQMWLTAALQVDHTHGKIEHILMEDNAFHLTEILDSGTFALI